MELHEIEHVARTLMDQHRLYGWSFDWDNARRRAGACHYGTRKITLSRHLMPNWSHSAISNVILHEIAHAKAGHAAGHGPRWKAIAQQIGCTGDRCWTASAASPALPSKWIGRCPNGHTVRRDRRQRVSCFDCSPRFDERYLILWEPNPAAV